MPPLLSEALLGAHANNAAGGELEYDKNSMSSRGRGGAPLSTRFSLFVPPTPTVSFWIRLGQFCQRHKRKIVLFMTVMMIPFAYFTSKVHLTLSTQLMTPRGAPSALALGQIRASGIHASILNPVVILAYNVDNKRACPDGWSCDHSIAPSSKFALSPRCHDDDTDFRQALYALNISGVIENAPPADVTCDNVNALLGGKLCTMRTYNVSNDTAYDIHKFVKVYCPGTCANYCDADGFGNATAAEAIARRNANKTVLVPALFDAIAQLRVRMQKEFPELRPNDIRDITTMPVSNEKVRDVAHAYEVCFGANSMCMVWSVAVSIAVPDVW